MGGAGLNVISVETFEKLQVPYERLMPTRPFSGVTEGLTTPLGQVRLAVTFGTQANYRTELIDFDVADRKSTRLNSSHITRSRMPSSA